ncbi:MAG: cytochrome-c peroxidase [Planctomycetota bacterium]
MSLLALLAIAATASSTFALQGPPPPPPPLGPPPPPPPGNPQSPAKIQLGKLLFWDEQLSSTGTMACASCHVPERGGSDPRTDPALASSVNPGPDGLFGTPDDVRGSPGIVRSLTTGHYELSALFGLAPQVTGRKAPSSINAAYAPLLFWDGRAAGTFRDPVTNAIVLNAGAALESQAVAPLVSDVEMAHADRDWNQIVARVEESVPLRLSPSVPASLTTFVNGRDYPQIFQEAFGTPGVTPSRIAMAIASYERTQFSNQTPIDQFFGGNQGALTQLELQGQQVFISQQASCVTCHTGNLFTNQAFFYIGVRPQNEDLGRFAVTGNPADRGAMRVPSLRNVELRAPYFHNGSMATLEDVIDFYDRGGDFDAPNLPPTIRPLGLSAQQKTALAAFLRRPLTDARVASAQPPFDHPALYAGSAREPQVLGAATPGSGGFEPRTIALAPPAIGNGQFTVGVEKGLGGALAVLVLDRTGAAGRPFGSRNLLLARHRAERTVTVLSLSGTGPGNGWGSVVLDIPGDPALVGAQMIGQWIVRDPGTVGGLATSPIFVATPF